METATLLSTLTKSAPVVLITNAFDPYCLQATNTLLSYRLPETSVRIISVDEVDNGSAIEKESIASSKHDSLPHLYLNSIFFGGAEELEGLRKGKKLRGKLIDAGAIPKPKMEELEGILAASKFVVVVNSFSPYCFAAKEILQVYEITSDEKVMKYVYVDKRKDGEAIENAAIYRAKCANLPVMFLNGEPLGSLEELQDMHKDFTLEEKLAHGGVFNLPATTELQKVKAEYPLVMIKNAFSAYCLSAIDALQNLKLVDEKGKVVDPKKIHMADVGSKEGEALERAARIESKQREAPYIYIRGRFVPTNEFLDMSDDKKLEAELKTAGVL